jgi:amino acid adenylation domain-containing protein
MDNQVIEGFRLSPQQKQLWLLQEQSDAYRVQCAVSIEGPLRRDLFDAALRQVVSRYEILHTAFNLVPGMDVPLQVIVEPTDALSHSEVDLGNRDRQMQQASLEESAREMSGQAFDYDRGVVMRTRLLALEEHRHLLLMSLSALCADAWTIGNLVRELARAYDAALGGARLSDELVQYADFSEWQNELLEAEDKEHGREYWRKQQDHLITKLALPLEGRADERDLEQPPHRITLKLDEQTGAAIEALAAAMLTTPETTLLACWQILLGRLTGQREVTLAVAFDGRKFEYLHEAIGPFGKFLPIRCRLEENFQYGELLGSVHASLRQAQARQEYFARELAQRSEAGNFTEQPFPDIGFEYLTRPDAFCAGGVSFVVNELSDYTEPLKLKLSCVRSASEYRLEFNYAPDLYREDSIKRLADQFITLLNAALQNPLQSINTLPLLSASERRQVLLHWNQTEREYPQDICLHQLFEAQVERTPDATALIFEDQQLSYQQLNERANQLAHYLQEMGVGAEVLVGLCMERSVEMVVGLLGIMKAGGAYVPMDPQYPAERLSFMLKDAGVKLLLTQQAVLEGLAGIDGATVCVDSEWKRIAQERVDNPESEARADNLAYLIYTSGSTGRPKGVMVQHRSLLNLVSALETAIYGTQDAIRRVSVNAPLAFDASVKQVVQLVCGRTLCLIPEDVRRDTSALLAYLSQREIDALDTTPAQLRLLLREVETGQRFDRRQKMPRLVLVGGEAIDERLWRQLSLDQETLYYNLYGPTECTVDASLCRVSTEHPVPLIGRPLANVKLYVLDAYQEPVPIGVTGELYIGGAGVARGYLHRTQLSAERFIPDPFSQQEGARLYRTGDLARYQAGGELEYVGRVDGQVKVRGYRIELGEVEAVLGEHPLVQQCVVLLRDDVSTEQSTGARREDEAEETEGASDKRLVGYLVPAAAETSPTASDLRAFMEERLPEYMLPSAFVLLEEMPLTPNGKIDRLALISGAQSRATLDTNYEPPRTPVEELLASLWQEVLDLERVGVNDDFFELGGHSLLATQLISRIRAVFEIDVEMARLFERPTVAGLGQWLTEALQAARGVAAPPIVPVTRERPLPLSFAQQRLWFLDQLEPGSPFYNIPAAVRLAGELDVAAFEQTLREVVRRHEVLRTAYASVDGQPVQVIKEEADLSLPVLDLSEMPEEARQIEARRAAREESLQPFDLATGPMLRARLLKLSQDEHVVLLTMHHIVSDGWSMSVLIGEVSALYQFYTGAQDEAALPELQVQYADYAVWQREWLQGEVLERQLSYWRKRLGGELPVLELPTDRTRPAQQSYRGAHLSFELSAEIGAALKQLGQQEGVTLFMTLLAAFQLLLSRYSKQDDILVGSVIAGRTRTETERLIGLFLNTLVMRTDLSGEPGFRQLLKRVREVCLGAYAHQEVPFEKLVEELQPERDLSRSPIVQVAFGMQNAPVGELRLGELKLARVAYENEVVRFDLTLWIMEGAGGALRATWTYSADLFDGETIERMQGHFRTLLESIVREPETRISQLEMLTEEEQRERISKRKSREGTNVKMLRSIKRVPLAVMDETAASASVSTSASEERGEINE